MGLLKLIKVKIKERGIKSILKYLFITPIEISLRLVPYSPFKILVLKLLGAKIPFNAFVYDIKFINIDIGSFRNLKVGNYAHIGQDVLIDLMGKVEIQDYTVIGPRATILTHQSVGKISPLAKEFPEEISKVTIKRGAYIGSGATINKGITIGVMSVLGAMSFANKDIPDKSIAVGVPAKIIKEIQTKNN